MIVSKFLQTSLLTRKMAILLLIGLLSACGNKGNNEVVDSNSNSTSSTNTTTIVNGVDTSGVWEQQKANYACRSQYGGRLADRNFYVSSGSYYVQGSMTEGSMGGSASAIFMGVNPTTRDLLRIVQVSDGSNTWYNITTSFCGWNSFISDSVSMSQFQIYQGVVSNSFNCPVGIVNRAIVVFYSGNYGNIQTVFQPISNSCI